MEFIEVWNIKSEVIDNQFSNTPIIVGVVFIIYEGIVLFARKKWGADSRIFILLNRFSKPKYPASLIFFPIGIILILIGVAIHNSTQKELANTKKALNSPLIQTVEGIVEVEFEQPKEGHRGGDIVNVGDITFEIDYFTMSHYYNRSIAHGGVLSKGKYVRIHYLPKPGDEKKYIDDTTFYGDYKIIKIEETINK